MKKASKILFLIPTMLCMAFVSGKAQDAPMPFTGSIQYNIKNTSDMLPPEHLAQLPTSASIKMSKDKMVFEQADGNKAIVDAATNEIHTLANLSMMGLGKYHIIESVAETAADTASIQGAKLTATGQSKIIKGYTAYEYTATIKGEQGSVDLSIWCVPDFCNPAFNWATQVAIGQLNGFPLEYSLKTAAYTMDFVVGKLHYGDVDEKAFAIPKSYKPSTAEEMQKDVEEFMKVMGM